MSHQPIKLPNTDDGRPRSLRTFRRLIGEAGAARRTAMLPQTGWLLATLITFVLLYILIAIIDVPRGESQEFNFYDERGTVTALSAIFLGMGGGFAFTAFFLSRPEIKRDRCFWFLMAAALGFLSLDELVGFHERIGYILDRETTVNEIARKGNDLIVIAYGVLAVPLVIYFLPSILQFRKFPELLGVAFLFFVIHTAIDSTQEPPTTISIIVEESAKLFCSAFLAFAFFVGLLGSMNSSPKE